MIYLASPYSSPNPETMIQRYHATAAFTARAMHNGITIFSPIVYGHNIALSHSLPTDAIFWKNFNESLIRHCSAMWVLTLDGWIESKGVTMEIAYAEERGIPVEYKDYI